MLALYSLVTLLCPSLSRRRPTSCDMFVRPVAALQSVGRLIPEIDQVIQVSYLQDTGDAKAHVV
jgi:hypothetical protein